MRERLKRIIRKLTWTYNPATEREASDSTARNFLLHWFPAKVTAKSMSFSYSMLLGTIILTLFSILTVTGLILMFLYVPSVERAYWSIKDLEFAIPYGWFIRDLHRVAAQLMVAVVFIHLVRVFLTGAYKHSEKIVGSYRPLNWWIGLALLIVTMLLSYTGYLLPWDQLALWAITIGDHIALSAPIVGAAISKVLIGGTIIDQNTLIRWYVAHVFFLPVIIFLLILWHMWRIRKDGGLAVVEALGIERIREDKVVAKAKTYSLMGIVTGITPTITQYRVRGTAVSSSPNLTRRVLLTFVLVTAAAMALTFLFKAPLEEPASLMWTPNPAKAPWYFLWLQELVADTTIRLKGLTISGGFVGGIIIPTVLLLFAAAWPLIDRTPDQAIGVWFHKSRRLQNAVFLLVCAVIIALIYVGAVMRGPYWHLYMPWQQWIKMPTRF
ncbi:MAG: cytochrome b N-terminal domain-containing protein [Deltaproteobacteria bacterium]|nr:cytochrome b N-terminal domain-containing protein [Deltaproteobacteria bacterium]MCL5276748.1 cytochrome b N-terminal domain-containing protein [Deltaproteobacteria bacterium]